MGGTRRIRDGRFGIATALGLAAALLALAPARTVAQFPDDDPLFGAFNGAPAGFPQQGAMGVPPAPPEGAWGEVINATDRWLVIQNHLGQQFPVAIEDVREFLIRWPGRTDLISPTALVEAIGFTPGSNVVRTGHVDYFEGADRTLVAPTHNEVLPNNMIVTTLDPGFNRYMNAWDYAGQNMLYGWAYPVPPGVAGNPARLHVVGNLVAAQPIRIVTPGNVVSTIVPQDPAGITVTQITRGNTRYVRPGDYAFLMPIEARLRGLRLSQLVVYKRVPFTQFNPDAK